MHPWGSSKVNAYLHKMLGIAHWAVQLSSLTFPTALSPGKLTSLTCVNSSPALASSWLGPQESSVGEKRQEESEVKEFILHQVPQPKSSSPIRRCSQLPKSALSLLCRHRDKDSSLGYCVIPCWFPYTLAYTTTNDPLISHPFPARSLANILDPPLPASPAG